MGIEFKLSDRELPVSPAFIGFLAKKLLKRPAVQEIWSDQRSEVLLMRKDGAYQDAAEDARFVMGSADGRAMVARAYSLLLALLIGDRAPIEALQSRFQFVTVIGIPRTGGSYLTAELYRAIGMRPEEVPSALAHDSFPEAEPFQLQQGINSWVLSMKTMAEYLTMVELFFSEQQPRAGKVVVPKKLTKGIYSGGFFLGVFGKDSESVLTVRHPAAACVSTYEKSGGLPADGRFTVRSNIEEWCRRDLQCAGWGTKQIVGMDYFNAYLRYWEQYHLLLATTGLAAGSSLRVVAFSRDALAATAQGYHDRYASGLRASEFQVSDAARRRHPEWIERARPSIERISSAWKSFGLRFPADEISACC